MGRFRPGQDDFHSRDRSEELGGPANLALVHIHGGKRAQSAMVDDVRVRDRKYDPRPDSLASEYALEEAHVRGAVGLYLCLHAVVGRDPENHTLLIELSDEYIQPRIESIRLRAPGRILVLDVVRGREVELIEAPLVEQPDSQFEAIGACLRVVNAWIVAPNQRPQVFDAVLGGGRCAGVLDREADSVQVLAQQAPQLVLDCDRSDGLAGSAERSEDRRRAQIFRIVHRHFAIRPRVVVVVSADAVHVGGDPGYDRHVIRIRERWNDGTDQTVAAKLEDPPEARHEMRRFSQILAIAAVQTNRNDRPQAETVVSAVYRDCHGARFQV